MDDFVVGRLLESARTDVKLAVALIGKLPAAEWSNQSLCLLSFSVEKLLKLALYVRDPLLLLTKSISKDEYIKSITETESFGKYPWLKNHIRNENLVGLKEAWKVYGNFSESLSDFEVGFQRLCEARNGHVHTFFERPSAITCFIMSSEGWKILAALSEDLDSDLDDFLKQARKKSVWEFLLGGVSDSEIDKAIDEYDEAKLLEEEIKKNSNFIKKDKIKDSDVLIKAAGVESSEWQFERACPNCQESGQVGFDINDEDYDDDVFGERKPVSVTARLVNFACLECGLCTDSLQLLETVFKGFNLSEFRTSYLDYDFGRNAHGEIEKHGVVEADVDKKGYTDGFEVHWVD